MLTPVAERTGADDSCFPCGEGYEDRGKKSSNTENVTTMDKSTKPSEHQVGPACSARALGGRDGGYVCHGHARVRLRPNAEAMAPSFGLPR